MEKVNSNVARVQHLTKSSSDQLLNKFAEVGCQSKHKILAKRVIRFAKRGKRSAAFCSTSSPDNALAERDCLLPPAPATFIKKLGANKYKIKSREVKSSRSIMLAIEKTWLNSVKGASTFLMEKHYNGHKRLISDN